MTFTICTHNFLAQTSGMGGDFNALLEFADGEDGEEDNEKLPSNLFDDLDADEEER